MLLHVKVLVSKESHWKFVTVITHLTGMAQWILKDGPNVTRTMQSPVSTDLVIHFTVYKWPNAVPTKMHDGHNVRKSTGLHHLMQQVG